MGQGCAVTEFFLPPLSDFSGSALVVDYQLEVGKDVLTSVVNFEKLTFQVLPLTLTSLSDT